MTKAKVNINMDPGVLQEAKLNHINISEAAEAAVRAKIAYSNGDISGINIQAAKLELEGEENKLTRAQNKVTKLRDTIHRAEEQIRLKAGKRIKEEQTKLEAIKRCINCGSFLEDGKKKLQFKKGHVCSACFGAADKEAIRRWNNES